RSPGACGWLASMRTPGSPACGRRCATWNRCARRGRTRDQPRIAASGLNQRSKPKAEESARDVAACHQMYPFLAPAKHGFAVFSGRVAARVRAHAGAAPSAVGPSCRTGRGGSALPSAIDPPMPGYTRQISQSTVHMTVRCGRQGSGTERAMRRAEEEEHVAHEVKAATVEWNPAADRLRELAEKMPNAVVTEFGNVAVTYTVDTQHTVS